MAENLYAFPAPDDDRASDGYGMTLRDWFAGQALAGDLGSQNEATGEWGNDSSDQYILARAKLYYRFADAMLLARQDGAASDRGQG